VLIQGSSDPPRLAHGVLINLAVSQARVRTDDAERCVAHRI
jgi:hypothetical protein